jgi:heterodisulfide reductase subunit A
LSDSVLVVGGGIAGIQSALDLAEAGARVVLVEKEPTIGGIMAVLDKNFPTLDCSICIEAPKMSEVELHPNIEILSPAEVIGIEGDPGAFKIQIKHKTRFVHDTCTRCGDCTQVCPVTLPNEFDSGMASRRAIYTPIPQSVPGTYLVDIASCLNDPPNYLPCDKCAQICAPKSIDFLLPREMVVERKVGSVILAIGYDTLNPQEMREFGYGTHPDILTALEFERLVNSAGPTGGALIRPSDGIHPDSVLFVLCVGSRDQRFQKYCSRFCCMYSIKHAYQALDHGISNVSVMYMDIRAFGKGFDGFWTRTQEAGANFLRGRPSSIRANGSDKVRVRYEDIDLGKSIETDYDMVVLANAVTPPEGLHSFAKQIGIDLDEDGFIKANEIEGGLVVTTRPGVYAAGCATGPKDIPDSVSEGSGAASLALGHLTERYWPEPEEIEPMLGIEESRVGVFVCHCGSNIAGVVDVEDVVEYAKTLPDVAYAGNQMFSCAGNTQKEIEDTIRSEHLTRVVIAACSPKTHESIFRDVLVRAGLNPYLMVMSNIRNMDSWVHKFDKHAATIKAKDMVAMAVEKARQLEPLEISHLPITQRALVVGGGIAGLTASIALSNQGIETHLVEQRDHLGGLVKDLFELSPSGTDAQSLIKAKTDEVHKTDVHVHCGTSIENISGVVGNFHAQLSSGEELQVGAVVLATGSRPYQPDEFQNGHQLSVITNLELDEILKGSVPTQERITFIACVGSRQGNIGCSRYCCTSMIGQALRLREQGKKVRVLYKEIRTYSRQAEELYELAMRKGVQFFRYDDDKPPQDTLKVEGDYVQLYDHFLNEHIRIPTELLVLVVGLIPSSDALFDQLKLAHSEDDFLMELHPKLGPAETASQGIYLAGAVQGAKDVRESMAQALAASAKAGALLSRSVIEKEPLTAKVIEELCIGCMLCVKVCPYGAIEPTGPVKEGIVRILEATCLGCGTCAAECNFDAIDMPYFTKDQILSQIDAALAMEPERKCLVFTCNWCSYAGADLAGIEKRQYPTSARIIRTMCSARFEEDFIARSFDRGAGAVLVTGCRLTETGSDCHYNYANRLTWKRFKHWQRKFGRKGIDPDRLQLRWISAAEGKEFAEKIHDMDGVIQKYVANLQIRETIADSATPSDK